MGQQIAEYGEDPRLALGRLKKQLEKEETQAREVRENELRAETRLEQLAEQGPYSALVAAEEEVARLRGKVCREEDRVAAIRFLHATVNACRASALAEVAEPVERAATRMLWRVAGPRLGRIRVGEGFEPGTIEPPLAGKDGVDVENLSGGEKEQLYLATRLALAEVLSRDERQLVVLDDVLTATDAGRLARVLGLLEEEAERMQILVLTCHPERYRGLAQARFFDFEALRSA